MGYKGHIDRSSGVPLDLQSDIKNTIGKEIELSFFPNIPEEEKRYKLKDANLGVDVRGLYIHFILEENDNEVEHLITGIKYFEYDIHPTLRKYWVYTTSEVLAEEDEGINLIPSLSNADTYRFMLFI